MATLFVVLIQSAYRVPLQNKATGFALKAMGSACLSLCLSTTGQYSFEGFFLSAFPVSGAKSHRRLGYAPAPLPGQEGKWPLQAILHFPIFPLIIEG